MAYQESVQFTELQQQLILGSLLGDASLTGATGAKNYHWAVYHAVGQREYLEHKHALLRPFVSKVRLETRLDKRDGKIRTGLRFFLPSIPWFTELRMLLYPEGKKVVTSEFLERIHHPIGLAMLIGDDGGWDKAGIQIATKGFSIAENNLLLVWLQETFQITASLQNPADRGQKWPVYPSIRIPASEMARMRDLCFPWLPASLWYKFGHRAALLRKT